MRSCGTARSMRPTTSRRATSPILNTTAPSPASRWEGRSSAIARFSSPTTKARAPTKGITRISTVPTDADLILPSHLFLRIPWECRLRALYPSPNRPGLTGNYVASPTQRDSTDHFDVRSDTAFGAAFDLMGRYSFADRRLFEPFSGPGFSSLPGYGSDVDAARPEFRRRAARISCRRTF